MYINIRVQWTVHKIHMVLLLHYSQLNKLVDNTFFSLSDFNHIFVRIPHTAEEGVLSFVIK